MNWLITAFEPFAGAQSNSSWLTLQRLREVKQDKGFVFLNEPVPVTFSGAWEFVHAKLESVGNVDGLLCLGQAETRSKISLEQVALNWVDARIPDNQGITPPMDKIDKAQPDVLWSSIPWERLSDTPNWDRSYSAGTYVCNQLMFKALTWARANQKLAGFVHIPLLESQNGALSEQINEEAFLQILSFLESL